MITSLGIFPAAASGITYEFLASPTDATGLTTYTFNSVAFGTATADRLIIVTTALGAVANRTVSSATIGGVAATLVSNTSSRVHVLSAVVTSGTSGTIAITFSGAGGRCGIEVHSIKGYASSTASGTNSSGLVAAVTNATATVTVPANGVGIAGAFSSAATTVSSWTGCTQQNDTQIGATNTMSAAEVASVAGITNNAFKCTFNASGSTQVVAATWA